MIQRTAAVIAATVTTADEIDDGAVIDSDRRKRGSAVAPLVDTHRIEPESVHIPLEGRLDVATPQDEVVEPDHLHELDRRCIRGPRRADTACRVHRDTRNADFALAGGAKSAYLAVRTRRSYSSQGVLIWHAGGMGYECFDVELDHRIAHLHLTRPSGATRSFRRSGENCPRSSTGSPPRATSGRSCSRPRGSTSAPEWTSKCSPTIPRSDRTRPSGHRTGVRNVSVAPPSSCRIHSTAWNGPASRCCALSIRARASGVASTWCRPQIWRALRHRVRLLLDPRDQHRDDGRRRDVAADAEAGPRGHRARTGLHRTPMVGNRSSCRRLRECVVYPITMRSWPRCSTSHGRSRSKSPMAIWGTKRVMNYSRDHSVADGLEFPTRELERRHVRHR